MDILDKLKAAKLGYGHDLRLFGEASDEIARLRAENERLAAAKQDYVDLYNSESALVLRLEKEAEANRVDAERYAARVAELENLLWTPENEDFVAGVMREAGHQVDRWGSEHDAGKAPLDWFWLVGYLFQKAVTSWQAGDIEKAKHHCISTAAVCANAHAHLGGSERSFRPGLGPERQEHKPSIDAARGKDNG